MRGFFRRLVFFVMLGLLLTARLIASPSLKKQRNQEDEKKPSATEDCREHADHRHPNRTDIPPLPCNAQTDEREHRQAERNHWNKEERFWRRQIWFNAATTLAAVLAAIAAAWALNFSRQAVEQAQVQAEISRLALLNADRPWVRVEGLSSAELRVLDTYVFVITDIRVKNIGHSPAGHAFAEARLLVSDLGGGGQEEAESVCGEAIRQGYPSFDRLLFPDKETDLRVTTGAVSLKSIVDARDAKARSDAEYTRRMFKEFFGESRRLSPRLSQIPILLGPGSP